MSLPVTAALAAAMAFLLLVLAIDTVRQRLRLRLSHGTGQDKRLTSASRSHGNLAEHAPIVIILVGLLEMSRASHVGLMAVSAAFILGRLLHVHGLYFPRDNGPPPTRTAGVIVTWLVLAVLVVWTLGMLVGNLSD